MSKGNENFVGKKISSTVSVSRIREYIGSYFRRNMRKSTVKESGKEIKILSDQRYKMFDSQLLAKDNVTRR